MNPAAPRDPVLTRVLLSIAGALFLLNLCVLVVGIRASDLQTVSVPPEAHANRCIHGHIIVATPDVDEMIVRLRHVRARVEGLSLRMEEAVPQLKVVVEAAKPSDAL